MEQEKEKVSVEHSGDHHLLKVAVDPETKEVSAGGIYSFSDNAAASLQVVDGKMEGTILHSGDNHNLRINVSGNGSYEGVYKDFRFGGVEIVLKSGEALLLKGKIPLNGIVIKGDHHNVKFTMNDNGKISGSIESINTQNGIFQLNIEQGKLTGSFVHRGANHESSFVMNSKGDWKASVAVGNENSKFTVSVEKGKAEMKGLAGLKLKF